MRRLASTPVLIVLFCLCVVAVAVLGAQLAGVQLGSRAAGPPTPAPRPAATRVAAISEECVITTAGRRFVKSVLLTVANDPLTVRSGHTICLAAYTVPHMKVSLSVFGTTRAGVTDAKGVLALLFTAPSVSAPTKYVYLCHVADRRPDGTVIDLPGSERFRVIP
jgi:hypothetical protein